MLWEYKNLHKMCYYTICRNVMCETKRKIEENYKGMQEYSFWISNEKCSGRIFFKPFLFETYVDFERAKLNTIWSKQPAHLIKKGCPFSTRYYVWLLATWIGCWVFKLRSQGHHPTWRVPLIHWVHYTIIYVSLTGHIVVELSTVRRTSGLDSFQVPAK